MMVRRITILIVAVSLAFLCGQSLAAIAVSVSKIDGYDSTTGGLMAITPIRYYIHFQVGSDSVVAFVVNFRVYSPDSANWQPLVPMELIVCHTLFDFHCGFINGFGSVNGMGADTIGFAAVTNVGPGFVPGFDSDYILIETSLTEEQIGKTLCLDSSYLFPNEWVWVSGNTGPLLYSWDGPYCFEIVDCCSGNRGDLNGDGVDANILDLVFAVDRFFRGGPPAVCLLEADAKGDNDIFDFFDLIFLIDFIFRNGPAPPACPN